jgi:hypothetical protein
VGIPQPVQSLLKEFKSLFDVPQNMPPRHTIDHKITLILGAQLVNVRPYRYSPLQKSEIKKQVNEMMHS